MNNQNFNIEINTETGFISSISHPDDAYHMNWCAKDGAWGRIYNWCLESERPFYMSEIEFRGLTTIGNASIVTYAGKNISVSIKRFFNEKGNFEENVTIKNITDTVICITRDNFGIEFPLNDRYRGADECMIRHCHTHIWCGHHFAWIDALRMGDSKMNLGIALTKGAIDCYSQNNCFSNIRGNFILQTEPVMLKAGEEYDLNWEYFWHEGKEDFEKKLSSFDNYVSVKAVHHTVFEGEKIEFSIYANHKDEPKVTWNGKKIDTYFENGVYKVSYYPTTIGEYRIKIVVGDVTTYAEFNVKKPFAELLEKRVDFIVENQQCKDSESPLYGAFLIYDNKTESTYFDNFNSDHNACRERMNIALLLIKYLQFKKNTKVREAVELFMKFIFRECYEETTGEVFNTIGKNQNMVRLYNAPGIMLLFSEMYILTKEEKYLDNIIRLAENYYSIGGEKCYANGLGIERAITAFEQSERKGDKEKLLMFFKKHVDNIVSIGTAYPPHEVVYEQTIVTPAVKHIAEYALYSNNKEFYAEQAKVHMACLERFSGHQPSHFLNEIAVRFWDDFWFGKQRCFGDTLPHHLSVLTARGYVAYSRLTGEKGWIEKAEENIRNCMCLIGDDGHGFAAHVYPYRVNENRGDFYDEWSNDQDLVLYDALLVADVIETFKLGV